MKKYLSLLLALVLALNLSVTAIHACEEDPECTCNCEDCITEECECPCHVPAPVYGGEHGEEDDWFPKQ